MCEERLVSGTWYFRTIQASAYIQNVAMPLKRDYAEERTVFYTGSDGVHAISDNSEPWFGTPTDSLIYADSTVTSAPIPFNDQNGGVSVVFISNGYGWSFVNVLHLARVDLRNLHRRPRGVRRNGPLAEYDSLPQFVERIVRAAMGQFVEPVRAEYHLPVLGEPQRGGRRGSQLARVFQ
jgi:hypothetical protein